MITMLSNSLIEQLYVNRRTCHIAMTVVSADSFRSMVWWGARAACADVSTGSVDVSKARLGVRSHMALRTTRLPVYTEDYVYVCVLSMRRTDFCLPTS
jgi:hypothetical protein